MNALGVYGDSNTFSWGAMIVYGVSQGFNVAPCSFVKLYRSVIRFMVFKGLRGVHRGFTRLRV